jgi:REP element-mobilizing transposase RayT
MYQTHFHRRNLPHYYQPNSTNFITFRLKGTIPRKVLQDLNGKYYKNRIPKSKVEKYYNDKLFFIEYDKFLDFNNDIQFLKNQAIAYIVKKSLQFYNGLIYNLICFTVMPNHVHVVFHLLEKSSSTQTVKFEIQEQMQSFPINFENVTQTFQTVEINKLMKSIKGYSAREANKILNRKGSFWQSKSYDHIVRNEDELERIIKYVVYNPVKAGLVDKWEEWEHTYLAEDWW